jgi:hypothetical protein
MLPDCGKESIGFGGTFRNKMINCPVKLTFGNEQKYTVPYDSGFRVVVIPNEIDRQQREKLIRYTPSVLGMDVLQKFKVYIDKKKVELTI